MLGCYDFCAHYEWTFAWLEARGGDDLVRAFWEEAIARDSQAHARTLILEKGVAGMKEYWGHTLQEEGAEYSSYSDGNVFRIAMHDCPSKGFLLRNDLEQYSDYCDHCIGWIGPLMKEAGFKIHHEHNHRGQCWWEFFPRTEPHAPSAPGEKFGAGDVRLDGDWDTGSTPIDTFIAANGPKEKNDGSR